MLERWIKRIVITFNLVEVRKIDTILIKLRKVIISAFLTYLKLKGLLINLQGIASVHAGKITCPDEKGQDEL